jgi:tRNA(Ile)-lysidine synthase
MSVMSKTKCPFKNPHHNMSLNVNDQPLEYDEFQNAYGDLLHEWLSQSEHIAFAVSGGPDSMALCHLMHHWAQGAGKTCHALTVDHGLRPESEAEAKAVQDQLKSYPNLSHTILKWDHDNPSTRIQESARDARYELMAEYCKSHGIAHLFLAHHADDQAETVLFRLAKGSGLDGLGGMKMRNAYNSDLSLCRPFLDIEKSRLIATCDTYKIKYIEDPSNENETYARARLRKARNVLEAEGLTTKRLMKTAQRMTRASDALKHITQMEYPKCVHHNPAVTIIDIPQLLSHPHEIIVRIVIQAMEELAPEMTTRMERIENLCVDIIHIPNDKEFRKRTLGGVVFDWNAKKHHLTLTKEHQG